MFKLFKNFLVTHYRIFKIEQAGFRKCEICCKYKRKLVTIYYLEAGIIICKQCAEQLKRNGSI